MLSHLCRKRVKPGKSRRSLEPCEQFLVMWQQTRYIEHIAESLEDGAVTHALCVLHHASETDFLVVKVNCTCYLLYAAAMFGMVETVSYGFFRVGYTYGAVFYFSLLPPEELAVCELDEVVFSIEHLHRMSRLGCSNEGRAGDLVCQAMVVQCRPVWKN